MPYTSSTTTLKTGSSTTLVGFKSYTWGSKRNNYDATTLGSNSMKFFPTTMDPGTITGTLVFDPMDTIHKTLLSQYELGTVESKTITLGASGVAITCDGFFSSFTLKADSGTGALEADVEIQCSGDVTIVGLT